MIFLITQWLACKEHTSVFKGNEKALLFLLECSESQQEALLKRFNFEDFLKSCLAFLGEENISWDQSQIIYTNMFNHSKTILTIHDFYLILEVEKENAFEDYLLRVHQKWCLFHHKSFVKWIPMDKDLY